MLYISSINDEMLNRTKDAETYFNYKYGWSFAFAAISFLLTEVTCPILPCARLALPYLEGRREASHSILDHPIHSTALPQNVPLPGFPGSLLSWRFPRTTPAALALALPLERVRGCVPGRHSRDIIRSTPPPISELSSASLSPQSAGVMSVYLFMKRYTAEDMYRPHPGFYRPRLSNCSDYSGQFLHPDAWIRGRSPSDISSDASLQMNSNYPALLKCPDYDQMSSSPC